MKAACQQLAACGSILLSTCGSVRVVCGSSEEAREGFQLNAPHIGPERILDSGSTGRVSNRECLRRSWPDLRVTTT